MSKENLYQILGIDRTASDQEIKTAYRRLAMKHHPDRNKSTPQSEEQFKKVKQAYEVLIDPIKRQNYDQYGTADPQFHQQGNPFSSAFSSAFSDMFSQFYAAAADPMKSASRNYRGNDIQVQVGVTLEQLFYGANLLVNVPQYKTCSSCQGSGNANGKSNAQTTCPRCRGTGYVSATMQNRLHSLRVNRECEVCHGTGKHQPNPCSSCQGRGFVADDHAPPVSVTIPPGTLNARLVVSGKGEPPLNSERGSWGDLVIMLHLKEHFLFKLDERNPVDLVCEIPIRFEVAVNGGTVEVPTFDGNIQLKIPAHTSLPSVLKVSGKGFRMQQPQTHGRLIQGDLYCRLVLDMPNQRMSDAEKNAVNRLSDIRDDAYSGQPQWKTKVARFMQNRKN